MSRAPMMICTHPGCGKNITMQGSQLCDTCDPNPQAIIDGDAEPKTPQLCDAHFATHVAAHLAEAPPQNQTDPTVS